MIYKYSGSKHR